MPPHNTTLGRWGGGGGGEKAVSVCMYVCAVGTKRSSLFAYRVTLILNDRVIIKGVQDIMKKKSQMDRQNVKGMFDT